MPDIEVVVKRDLLPWQEEVKASAARFKVLNIGRRGGKTHFGIGECSEVGLAGGRAWWVAPTYPIAMEGWYPLARLWKRHPEAATVRQGDKEIVFHNGGRVQVRSADDPQKLRGAGLDLLVMDEAAIVKPEAWFEALRPALSDREGKALFISTPKGHNWFYELYENARRLPGWDRWTLPSASNPYLSEADLEQAREEVGSLVYSQEYLAEFVAAGGTVFNPEWFTYYTPRTHADGYAQYVLPTGEAVDSRETTRFCTVDPAVSVKETADYTVIMCFAVWDKWILVLDVLRQRLEGPDIVPAVETKMVEWGLDVAWFERVAFQLSLIQDARRRGMNVKELRADRDKLARSMPAAARMEAGQVLWPREAVWAAGLERELQLFTGVQQEHDDQVDALSYGVRVANQRKERPQGVWPVDDLARTSPAKLV